MSSTLNLAMELIRCPSVTPADAGCQTLIAERLAGLAFTVEHLRFGNVENLWARRGQTKPLLVLAGHTDVVPPGPLESWQSDPFKPEIRSGCLYGRGAADMKGSLAAMVTAVERIVERHPNHSGSTAFLLTSDEEGPAVNGTAKVVEALRSRGEGIDWCLLGEPTSDRSLGDVIKNGRRGSLNGTLRVKGTQGHVAYPKQADNPIHCVIPALKELCAATWDEGSESFPPTTFQISNIHAGTGVDNVIPGTLELMFNFRFSSHWTAPSLQERVVEILEAHGVNYSCEWCLSGEPFLTRGGQLLQATRQAIREITGIETRISTSGGTSDGRFIAPLGAEVIELGPLNASIHKVDEHIPVHDLDTLSRIYERILGLLLL